MSGSASLKILQLTPWSVHGEGTGGMASVVRDLTDELQRQGHQVDILANAWQASSPVRQGPELHLRVPGPPTGRSLRKKLAWPVNRERSARRLRQLCKQEHVQVIHCHYAGSYLATVARARELGGPPFLVTCHGGDIAGVPELPNPQGQALRVSLSAASLVIAVSTSLAADVEDTVAVSNVRTVCNGFKAPWREVPDRADVETALGHALPDRYAVMVGNMRPCKGHDTALEAWYKLEGRSDLPLILVGGGPDFERMHERAIEFGLDTRAIFCGYLDRQIALGVIAYSTMVLAPSTSEGFGMFVLEAGALARPLVCSAIPPLTDILTHESNALTIPPADPAALAGAVLRLENDPELQVTIAKTLKAKVESDFSVEGMASTYIALYREILGRATS